MDQHLDLITRALPEQFPFYHLGEIRLAPEESDPASLPELADHQIALGFTLQGDLQAALVLLVAEGLDVSMYCEAGNIVASRLVSRLAREQGLDVLISPPIPLQKNQLQLLAKSASGVAQRTYLHAHGKNIVPVQAFILTRSERAGMEGRS